MLRRLLVLSGGFAVTCTLAVFAANLVMLLGTEDAVPSGKAAQAPRAQVALVLGAQVYRDGTLSPMLRDRVRTGAELYERGKVEKVLVSGDHGRRSYDEVNAMRRELERLGVPTQDVFTDHAGFDTWDSVVRAREVFRVRSALVVSQGFHLPRAVWLAERAGLQARGVASDQGDEYGGQSRFGAVREWVARTKAAADVVTGADPKFLGTPIPITGDGRASRG